MNNIMIVNEMKELNINDRPKSDGEIHVYAKKD